MELKFIWTKKFRIIQDLGFNFNHGGLHRFEYKNNMLNLHPNKKSILDFGRNITGVTVIAGENGSGKSTLCELALLSTATLTDGSFGYRMVFNGIVCFGNTIFINDKLSITNKPELQENGYEVVSFKDSPFEHMNRDWMDYFKKGGFIYYSNILDQRSYFKENNLTNISTQFQVYEGDRFGPYYSNYPSSGFYDEKKDRFDSYTLFERAEYHRFALFYLYFTKFIPFKGPSELALISTYSGNNRFLSIDREWKQDIFFFLKDIENNIFNSIYNQSYSIRKNEEKVILKKDNLQKAIHQLYKINALILYYRVFKILPDQDKIEKFIYEDDILSVSFFSMEFATLIKLHHYIITKIIDTDFEFSPYQLQERYKHYNDWRFILVERVFLANTNQNRLALKRLLQLEESVFKNEYGYSSRISNLSYYPRFSAGESTFISLFSRIFDVLRMNPNNLKYNKVTILFIDEAEIGFHPQWQKLYLRTLLTFLNSFDLKFQLILTTHSPYLLSDVTSENIILLKKSDGDLTEIVPSLEYKTFGANIHELLATSFFLRDGLMGEFAKEKIEELIGFLNNENQLIDKDFAKELILSIGDDIIASRLMDMYNERFENKDQFSSTEEYRSWLVSELKRINLSDNDIDFQN